MDFKTKNFTYASMPFGGFVDAVERGERLYLRALSSTNAKEVPTILEDDYPSIASGFKLPGKLSWTVEDNILTRHADTLKYVRDNMHSSPLRISGPVNMWLHYDVSLNIHALVSAAATDTHIGNGECIMSDPG
jgi:tRNA wybutosine-synthesizing protein 4